MITKKITKPTLWKGEYVSIRSYELDPAIRAGGMIIIWKGDRMTLSVDNLQSLKRGQEKGQFVKSKTGGKDYYMIDVKWQPDHALDKRQESFL
jgi:hypothetical protein